MYILAFLAILPLVTPTCVDKEHPMEAFLVQNKDHVKRVWWDRFGTAQGDFSCYAPDMTKLSPSWKLLGHLAQPNHGPVTSEVYAFRECREDVLAVPIGFHRVWDDTGSTHYQDGSLWRPNCPFEYVATSDFFYPANGISDPVDLYEKVRCVHQDFTEVCPIDRRIWSYGGTPFSDPVSVWVAKPSGNALGGPFLFGSGHATAEPGIVLRCLKKSSYIFV